MKDVGTRAESLEDTDWGRQLFSFQDLPSTSLKAKNRMVILLTLSCVHCSSLYGDFEKERNEN